MIYSNSRLLSGEQEKNSLLLVNEEAKMFDVNDKLLLPRSIKRRTSLLEKSRDWARRLITLHRPRRNTISNEIRDLKMNSSPEIVPNHSKSFDEDGYLSPMEIKALYTSTEENTAHQSPRVYRYHDPNIRRQSKRFPSTSFAAEFQKSLSIVDYIDLDVSDESFKADVHDDDPLESLKYLFTNPSKRLAHGNLPPRRIPRRSTNASSISTDSGYSDQPTTSTSKVIPVQLISCSLIPVNVRYLTCACRSTSCLLNHPERKYYSHSSRPLISRIHRAEYGQQQTCTCTNKSHSTMTIYPASTKTDDQEYYSKRASKKKRTNLSENPTATEDLIAISRWYKPYLEREAVHNVLQQADYGAFILRNSTTHSDCYALSIKVPKFTHDSNIVHYLIEKTVIDNQPSYRIKGTAKQFPTLLSLLTHHSVMPEILPITLSLNESFIL